MQPIQGTRSAQNIQTRFSLASQTQSWITEILVVQEKLEKDGS